ncbi:MAG: Eco57I restriction-modification methylase domain-containing protein [Methanosarcinales archaeon]|nr:Eco57I restriction-modification methylase domain-containing protein [Methanosarcinales archaeon]
MHTAVYFGNEVGATANKKPDDVYHDIVWAIKGDEAEWQRKTNRAWFREAQQIAEGKSFFHWELEFPDVFFEDGGVKENPGWDCVIGNPPYVSIDKISKDELIYLEFAYISAFYGRTDLYLTFIELSKCLSKSSGYFSMITPDKWLVSDYGELLRSHLLTGSEFERIWDLRSVKVFDDASNSPIVFVIKNTAPENNEIEFEIGIQNKAGYCKFESPQLLFLSLEKSKIKIGLTERKLNLIKKIESSATKLHDFCYISYGAQPGLLSKFVFYDRTKAFEGAKQLGEADRFESIIKPFIKGGNVARYEIIYDGGLMLYLPDKLHRPAFHELLENEKIVISEIANHLKGTYDNEFYYGNEKVVFVVSCWALEKLSDEIRRQRKIPNILELPKDTKDITLKFISALINSQLLDFYFVTVVGDLLNVYPDDVRQLPIRRINFITPPEERAALLESLKSKYNATEFDKIIQLVEECLPKDAEGNFITDEEKSDVVHDLLAFLAERMIEMNKDKNGEIQGFLEWFEREIDAKIETLTNKTKLKQYHDLGFDELLDILKKNKKKIPINLSNRELQGNLKGEFEGSMRKLKPLIERIKKTDWLIDQVVYRLYGLTEEAIRVVEESE